MKKRVPAKTVTLCDVCHREDGYLTECIVDLTSDLSKANQFKAFVHSYLDQHNVPIDDPENPHSKAGCRIGARLDMLFKQRDDWRRTAATEADAAEKLRVELLKAEGACDQAAAEAAVLREALKPISDILDRSDKASVSMYLTRPQANMLRAALASPGPGRKLAKRVKQLKAVAEAARPLGVHAKGAHPEWRDE